MTDCDDSDGTVSWRELLAETIHRLDTGEVDGATQHARWLVEEVSGMTGADLQLGLDTLATVRGVAELDALVQRRLAGEPVQYVLGHWPFRDLDLEVDGRVLIPRPETELVAEAALAELDALIGRDLTSGSPLANVLDGHATVLDLGTGSGALALSVATERPGVDVWAVEQSAPAARLARANLAGLGRSGRRVRIEEGSWFEPLPDELLGRVDLIVTNPPYIADHETLDESVAAWEPVEALFCGPEGTEAIAAIFADAPRWLAAHGVLVVEIGAGQGAAVARIATDAGFSFVDVKADLAGLDRIVVARRS